jgi:outer membrane protein assembly factor BamB
MTNLQRTFLPAALLALVAPAASGGDWPMWRYDAERSGASPENLPETLHLQWVLELPTPRAAWPSDQEKLQFDRLYEPVAAGKTLFVPSMLRDRLTAYDIDTAAEKWRFYAQGPVRFAPVVWEGRVYIVSDDGFLYALDAKDGTLLWKFRGGPSDRLIIGQDRLITSWPARGAPVVRDGTIYFGASLWPFMGIFLHALDARSGAVVWQNTGSGSDYMTQQHGDPAFAGVVPQGYLAATREKLVVSGGRTVPAVYDRASGKFEHFVVGARDMGSKGGGGYEVTVGKDFYLNRGKMYRLDTGKYVATVGAPIVTDYAIIGSDREGLRGWRASWKEEESKDRRGQPVLKAVLDTIWSTKFAEKIEKVFILSGRRLYCTGKDGRDRIVLAADPPGFAEDARISWKVKLPDEPLNMLSADGKLFITTDRGRIYCFGGKPSGKEIPPCESLSLIARGDDWRYLDDGSDQGTAWREPGFDDSKWASGAAPLGYGDPGVATTIGYGKESSAKHITSYFRRPFEVPAGADYEDLRLHALADDGAVFYLNGREIGRLAMPDGEIDHKTRAGTGAEGEYATLAVPLNLLSPGANVLAVEVHQTSADSSDLTFDLELAPGRERSRRELSFPRDGATDRARAILAASGMKGGYALVLGMGDGRLAEEIAAGSQCHVVVIERDEAKVDACRRRLDDLGVYGTHLAARSDDPETVDLPPYMAELVVSQDEGLALERGGAFIEKVFRSLRPYGGTACFLAASGRHEAVHEAVRALVSAGRLDGASLERAGDLVLLRRTAAPAGAGKWTHQYADAANTVKSEDTLVKAPLGLLWFGGASNEEVLPRHGHGPTPQVVGGRLFIEGRHMLRATDVYTGRLLWRRTFRDLGKWYDNSSHQPGANVLGSNYVSLEDGIYVVHGKVCLRLDPATGSTISEFHLPIPQGEGDSPDWGYVGVWGDYLIGSARSARPELPLFEAHHFRSFRDRTLDRALEIIVNLVDFDGIANDADDDRDYFLANINKLLLEEDMLGKMPKADREKKEVEEEAKKLAAYLEGGPDRSPGDHQALVLKRGILQRAYNLPRYELPLPGRAGSLAGATSRQLFAMDRESGKLHWSFEAKHEVRHNTLVLGSDKVFLIDRKPASAASRDRRRGVAPSEDKDARILALDIASGSVLWTAAEKVFGTWLGYSEEHDALLEAGSVASDRASDEAAQGMAVYKGRTGEVVWRSDEKYSGPCIIHGDTIITQGYRTSGFAYDLLTGKKKTRPHPVSGEPSDWQYSRNYGCNTVVASEHLLTFRSAAAGFFDLAQDCGTANIGGFRSGCTSNLIPADGVLSAPDYTRSCTCSYQNQSSLALVHAPEGEMWTFNRIDHDGAPVRHLGLNLGAPGDRRAPDGVLWLDFPSRGGPSPDVPVTVSPATVSPATVSPATVSPATVSYVRQHQASIVDGPLPWVAASGIEGECEIAVELMTADKMVILNEAPGGSALRVLNGTLCADVPAAALPGSGDANRESLRRRVGKEALRVYVPRSKVLETASVTVELWAFVKGDHDYIDARGQDPEGKTIEQGYVIDNRKLRVRYHVADEKGEKAEKLVTIEAKEAVQEETWVHIAFTYDAATGTGVLYQDGTAVGRHEGPEDRPLWWEPVDSRFEVAKGAAAESRIDELRISGRALGPEDFLAAKKPQVDAASLVAHWRMESARARYPVNERTYDVRLVFAEIGGKKPGDRVFDVHLQHRVVLDDFDIARAAGGANRSLVKEFAAVPVRDYLRIRLAAAAGKGTSPPLLMGVQVTESARGF